MTQVAPLTTVTSRDPQGLKFISVVEDAYNKARLSAGEEAQRVNDASGLSDIISKFIAEARATDTYVDEVTSSNYKYPSEYKGPKPIVEQIETLGQMFGLDTTAALAYVQNLPTLPDGAEGWFAIPRVEAIGGKFFPEITDPVERYCQAVNFVLEKIGESRSFYNYVDGDINKEHLRGHSRTIAKFGEVKAQQPDGDIIIIAAQLGMRHRGKSIRRARETFISDEYGLGVFAVGCIALIHPERFVESEELDIDCSGDEWSPDGDGDFSKSPVFYFRDDEVEFRSSDVSDADGYFGSASGFVPQN